jgi:hypothetical protein
MTCHIYGISITVREGLPPDFFVLFSGACLKLNDKHEPENPRSCVVWRGVLDSPKPQPLALAAA